MTNRTSWKCEGGVSLSLDNKRAGKGFSLVYGDDVIFSLVEVQPLTNVHLYLEGKLYSVKEMNKEYITIVQYST